MNLQFDKERLNHYEDVATFYVRGYNPKTEEYENHDVAHLTKESLLRWLRSRGGRNIFAENYIMSYLGHPAFKENEMGEIEWYDETDETWGSGGMADTADLKSAVLIGREGSNPSSPTNSFLDS